MNVETTKTCPNCQSALHGQFCFSCGQNQKAIDRHFWSLINEFLEEVFTPNSKAARTLYALSFQPGFLTKEYFSGRKARYIQPVRLYLTTSILFFFFISLANLADVALSGEESPPIVISADDEIVVERDWTLLSDEDSAELNVRVNEQIKKAERLLKEDPDRVRDIVLDNAPPVIFFLVPLFALLLKLIYFTKGRYYTQHLVLALHNHSFVFLALLTQAIIGQLLPSLIEGWIETAIDIWITIYLFLSLKLSFDDGWFKTGFKFAVLGLLYIVAFATVSLSAALVGVMTL